MNPAHSARAIGRGSLGLGRWPPNRKPMVSPTSQAAAYAVAPAPRNSRSLMTRLAPEAWVHTTPLASPKAASGGTTARKYTCVALIFEAPLLVQPPSGVGRAMFTAPVRVGSTSSTAATATTIAQLTSPDEMCHATTVQNSSAMSHGM